MSCQLEETKIFYIDMQHILLVVHSFTQMLVLNVIYYSLFTVCNTNRVVTATGYAFLFYAVDVAEYIQSK